MRSKKYSISDGRLQLTLETCEEGGFTVTSPMHPGLVTEAETIPEAFEMARDALKELRLARASLARESVQVKRRSRRSA